VPTVAELDEVDVGGGAGAEAEPASVMDGAKGGGEAEGLRGCAGAPSRGAALRGRDGDKSEPGERPR
jgi:hypothetical protein